jgi:uncharacterized protein YqeY
MASLKDRLEEDLKVAARARDELRLSVVRLLKSAIKYKEIELGSPLDDAGVVQMVLAQVKQRREAAEQFTKGGRLDLAEKESQELALLQTYLPQQLNAEEVAALVDAAVLEVGAKSMKEMSAVMKVLQPRVAGRAEGKVISAAVKARLESVRT